MATGVGMGFDLDALDKAIVKADNNLRKLAQDAEVQSKRISDAFSIGAAKGISQFAKEIANARGGISKLMAEGAEFKFTANGAKGFSAKVIDEINKVINYSRKEFENLNATITRSMLIKPTLDVNSIKELENRLVILNQGLATGQLGQGKGKKKIAVDDDLRVRINDEIKAINERLSLLRMSTAQFNQMKAQEATAIINNVKLEQEAIEAGKRRAQEAIQNYKRELDAARNAYRERKQMYEQLFKEQERQMSQNRRANYNLRMAGGNGLSAADNAMRYTERIYSDRGLRSINNMNLAIQKMQQAQQRLNLNTEQGRQKYEQLDKEIKRVKGDIDRVTGASENLNKSHKGLLDTSGQLARAMAAVFSVSAIKNFVNKLIHVRGEFELQQRSLQVLLQNKEEANKLWDKTVALAVKSPYTTQQLVTSTKQLAAYRIESEKLYETNKMLADVSIGLGVDMNRLILAFGQVKAANFLRGTELRQFSEAGVNMLDELAERFSALEGRAVSVGEVFERISKRMVTFADVEAVFKSITSKGGVFYQMQEKQADTMKGMLLNLRDSYELMLNDIGEQNSGTIKALISFLKDLISQWRTVIPFINAAATAFAVGFSVKRIIIPMATWFGRFFDAIKGLPQLFNNATKAVRGFNAASKSASLSSPWTVIAQGVLAATVFIVDLISATNKLEDSFARIDYEIMNSFGESVTLFDELTDKINDNTNSLKEQDEAYEELKQKFADILPKEYLELEYIKGKKGAYEDAEKAMLHYYNEKSIQQKRDKVEEVYGEEVETQYSDFLSELRDVLTTSAFTKSVKKEDIAYLNSALPSLLHSVIQEYKSGEREFEDLTDATARYIEFQKALIEKINEVMGEDVGNVFGNAANSAMREQFNLYSRNLQQLTDAIIDYSVAVNDIPEETITNKDASTIHKKSQELLSYVEEQTEAYNKLIDAYKTYIGVVNEPTDTEDHEERLIKAKEDLETAKEGIGESLKDSIKDLETATQDGMYGLNLILNNIRSGYYERLAKIVEKKAADLKMPKEITDAIKKTVTDTFSSKRVGDNDAVQAVKNIIEDEFKSSESEQKDLVATIITQVNNDTSISDIAKVVKARIEQDAETIKIVSKALNKNTAWSEITSMHQITEEQYEAMQKNQELLTNVLARMGYGEDGGTGNALEKFKKKIQLVREMADAYEEMWKKYGKAYADANIKSASRRASWLELGMDIDDFAVGTRQDEKNNLQKLLPEALGIKGGKLELEKATAKVEVEVQWQVREAENEKLATKLSNLFDDYQLTLEIDKLNIPQDLASKLFGFTPISLNDIRDTILKDSGLEDLTSLSNKDIFDSEAYKNLDDFTKTKVRETLEKVSDMEQKEQEERLKKYIAFSRKAMSERAKIKLEELQTIAEIEKTFAIKEEDNEEVRSKKRAERTRALAQASKDAADALQKLDWEAFKSSDTFNNIFDDLENASDEVLKKVIQQLKDFKSQWKEMPFEQMRQVVDLLNKAEGALKGSSNPFVEGTRLNREIRKDGRTAQEAQLDIWQAEQQKRIAEEALSNYEIFEKVSNGQLKASQLSTEQQKEYVEWQKKSEDAQRLLIAGKKLEIDEQDKIINKGNVHLNNIKKQKEAYEAQADAIGKMNQMAQDLYDSFKGLHEALGGDSDSPEAIFAEMGMSVTNSVASMIQLQLQLEAASESATEFGKAMNTALGVIGWINTGVTVLTNVINAFSQAYDNKKEKQIQREIKLIERLQKAYEDLEESIEKAYSIDIYEKAFQNANDNLEQQIQARERMIELEKDKKKTDWDRIKEYNEEIEELHKQQKELESQRLEELGGIGGEDYYKDAAQSFADAWLEAFYETGDGLTALEDEFDEVMKNLVKKQVLQRVAGALLQPLLTSIDTSVGNDGVFDEKEFAATMELAKQIFPEFNEKMKKVVEEMGMTDWAGKNAELGSLAAGIQGVSEETANVLASYMNSIRFYVADSNMQLKALVAAQGVNADTPNPMLSQLLTIAEQTRAIRDMFESVIGRGGNNKHGGAYLKVDIG